MTYYRATLPTALAAVQDAVDASITRYYSGSTGVIAGLPSKQNKVASVVMSAHDGDSAWEGAATPAQIEERLEEEYSVANEPLTFLPLGSAVWAGQTPGSQQVTAPIQIQFQADGTIDVRIAPAWVEEFKGKTLFIACET